MLTETGCVADAARVTGVSANSFRRAKRRIPEFSAQWDRALEIAYTPLIHTAWERAVKGVEVPIVRGGEIVATYRKPSDSLLRLLLLNGVNAPLARNEQGQFQRNALGQIDVATLPQAELDEMDRQLSYKFACLRYKMEHEAREEVGALPVPWPYPMIEDFPPGISTPWCRSVSYRRDPDSPEADEDGWVAVRANADWPKRRPDGTIAPSDD